MGSQERMLWHVFLVYDDYGRRVGKALGMTVNDIKRCAAAGRVLTDEDKARLQKLGQNGDKIDPKT